MKIAYLGPSGSFSHHVAGQSFPDHELVAYETITEVIKAYESQAVDYAVVPVENSIEGSVHETFDYLFHQTTLHACAEMIQPIKQQLLAHGPLDEIETVFSHPQAIAQGKKYIESTYPRARFEMTASTAYAARLVAAHPEKAWAAIATKTAAQEYGLEIIGQDIQEMDENYTRFWILGKQEPVIERPSSGRKISLALTLPDNLPGALYKALSTFAWRDLDLTKIESRPLKTALGEYFFIVDVDDCKSQLVSYALEELESIGISYKILGRYQVYWA